MRLEQLNLVDFKNYREVKVFFSEKFNCIAGKNGAGKTNLLDAIYYLSFCKSYFNSIDSQNVRGEERFFVIQGSYVDDSGNFSEVYCGLKRGEKKSFRLNKKEYERLSEHIGLLPLVIVSPEDHDLVRGGSELRRKFLDGIISQYDKFYLEELIQYNRVLQQRNTLLKSFADRRYFDQLSIDIYNEQLVKSGNYLFQKRTELFESFNVFFNEHYRYLSGGGEEVSMKYQTRLIDHSFDELLKESINKDLQLQYTGNGVHKDDLEFIINGQNAKKFASQGQQKSLLLALKLAQYEFIFRQKKTKPILLLDDIYDKLDEGRLTRLLELVGEEKFGQIFITDTHQHRIGKILMERGFRVKEFQPLEGTLIEVAI
jgi:DNA replication and repair protein RecF